MAAYGVDGCRGGWFFVRIEGPETSFGVVPSLGQLVSGVSDDASIFVDIPIGLRDRGPEPRGCDVAARRLLGRGRASSVFTAPLRPVLSERTHASASARNKALSGRGLTIQAFGILPKIREVDDLLSRDARARALVREVHPELCFWSLAGGRAMAHPKKSREGFEERREALARVFPGAEGIVDDALARHRRKDVARDDVADALVLAITGSQPRRNLRTVPEQPEIDATGLPMEMVYAVRVR